MIEERQGEALGGIGDDGLDARGRRIAHAFEWPMLVAALLVVPVIIVERAEPPAPWPLVAAIVNWLIWLAFAAELVTMLVVARRRGTWLARHPIDLLVVVLTPPFLPAALQTLRLFRVLRLLRLVRGIQAARALFTPGGLRYAATVCLFVIFMGGAAFTAIEGSEQQIHIGDGLWWAVTTATTVGYGDIAPVTPEGRAIAILLMVAGIGFVALLTGALAERFAAQNEAAGSEREEILTEIRALNQRLDTLEQHLSSMSPKRPATADSQAEET